LQPNLSQKQPKSIWILLVSKGAGNYEQLVESYFRASAAAYELKQKFKNIEGYWKV